VAVRQGFDFIGLIKPLTRGRFPRIKSCQPLGSILFGSILLSDLILLFYPTAAAASTHMRERHQTEASPWLDLTKWQLYLQGHDLACTAQLVELPIGYPAPANAKATPTYEEPQLVLLLDAFVRIIDRAHSSLLKDKVNVFD
jgi:hypothetical protein